MSDWPHLTSGGAAGARDPRGVDQPLDAGGSTGAVVPERFSEAVARLEGDVDLLREMACMTSKRFPGIIAAVESAMDAVDLDSAAKSLHQLKGMLSTFETEGVIVEIQDLLNACRAGESDSAREKFDRYRGSIDELVGMVTAFGQRT